MVFKNLSQGIKISISRSITTSFEQYMSRINWDENKFSMQSFMNEWREYINEHASWYNQISEEMKNDPRFHQELAERINTMVEKILSEEPTEEQIQEMTELEKQLRKEVEVSCKMEAKYMIEKMQNALKKKQSN